MNNNFDGFTTDTSLITSSSLWSLRLQKINSTFIRYLLSKNSYEIYLNSSYKLNLVPNDQRNQNLYKYTSDSHTFYYHNQFIFYSNPNGVVNAYLYMKGNFSINYIRFKENKKYIHNCMGYQDEINDRLEMVYQYINTIKYIVIKNLSFLFYYECESKTFEVLSNQNVIFNVSELMTYPLEHDVFTNAHIVNYPSTDEEVWSYDNGKIHFSRPSQILNVTSDLNDWIIFHFYFFGGTLEGNITIYFYFVIPTCLVKVRACAFKCGSCSQDFYTCDPGSCKKNFAMLRNSSDTDCYPNDQNMPNYIYNKTTNYYEECYSSCKFCSRQKDLSSNLNHYCLTCNDGYLKSYEYMGNCYLIGNQYNNSDTKIIINNQGKEEYTFVDSCLDKYIIVLTGECVTECPTTTVYNSYTYVYKNLTAQGTSALGKMYPLTIENIPKYKLGNLCYGTCPNLTSPDKYNNLCKCNFGW